MALRHDWQNQRRQRESPFSDENMNSMKNVRKRKVKKEMMSHSNASWTENHA